MANWGIRTYFIQVLQALWAFCFVSRYDPRLQQMGKLSSNQSSTSCPGVKNTYTSADYELCAIKFVFTWKQAKTPVPLTQYEESFF